MPSMSDALEDALRDAVLFGTAFTPPTSLLLALYRTATTDAGGGVEVTGGGYERQPVTFDPGSSGAAASADDVVFDDLPAGTITHAALHDEAGAMLLHGPLTAAKTVLDDGSLTFPAGDITATFT